MKSGAWRFAVAIALRVIVAFAIGICYALGLLLWQGGLHDTTAHHVAAATGGDVTLLVFLLIMAWWMPQLHVIETHETTGSTR